MGSILHITLRMQPNAVRLRIWRALKSLGCVALRDLHRDNDQRVAAAGGLFDALYAAQGVAT